MNVAFFTFGCKLNQSETESLASHYNTLGFGIKEIDESADYYIINTCTVTSKSEQKARRVIRNLARANPDALVIVTGCYAQLAAEELGSLAVNVMAVPQEIKSTLFAFGEEVKGVNPGSRDMEAKKDLLRKHLSRERGENPFRFNVEEYQFHSRAFLKIQDGCNNFCAYCRVPLARGRSVSLERDQVLQRAGALKDSGYREIVLTGVNISSYHHQDWRLGELVRGILDAAPGVRIRLSSLEPEKIDEKLVSFLDDPRICDHFHIPFQSGSDAVLKAMGRRYTRDKAIQAMTLLKAIKPEAFFSGDVIVGFPGEEEVDFQASREFAETRGFAGLHVFPFSPRPGTKAYKMKNQVPERTRKERAIILSSLAERLFEKYAATCLGREVDIILEKSLDEQEGLWQGLSGNYLKTRVRGVPVEGRKGCLVRGVVKEPGAVSRAEFVSLL